MYDGTKLRSVDDIEWFCKKALVAGFKEVELVNTFVRIVLNVSSRIENKETKNLKPANNHQRTDAKTVYKSSTHEVFLLQFRL